MKLEVGMYVRTRYGIAKITNLSETIDVRGFYLDEEIMDCNVENWKSFCTIHDIIGKPSHSIIDLIEVGDYVNGEEVDYIIKPDVCGDEELDDGKVHTKNCGRLEFIELWQIKSIVTKEQFESMSYKVED